MADLLSMAETAMAAVTRLRDAVFTASWALTMQADAPVPLVVLSDPGQDLDDEMAFIMMKDLEMAGFIDVQGIVCTLTPASDRARLCRGTLDLLGLAHVRVGIGTDGGDLEGQHNSALFVQSASSYMPAAHSEQALQRVWPVHRTRDLGIALLLLDAMAPCCLCQRPAFDLW